MKAPAGLFALTLALGTAAGCGDDGAPAGTGAGGAGGAGATVSTATATSVSQGAFILTTSGAGGSDIGGCAKDTKQATRAPLDVFVMVDSSGSMSTALTKGGTKWQAVKTALSSFFDAPDAASLSAELQFFPLVDPNVPATCTLSKDCGPGGPCSVKVCDAGARDQACDTNGDCDAGVKCVSVGKCLLTGETCYGPTSCSLTDGACVQQPTGYCESRDSCDPLEYADPAVKLTPLPEGAATMKAALDGREPDGETPTGAALHGALQGCVDTLKANPGHVCAVVFVTDGLPTTCGPNDPAVMANLASQGLAITPAIKTFVLGVFAPQEAAAAQEYLDVIAKAGGTDAARIVSTEGGVAGDLATALDAVRTSALPCELEIPVPDEGTPDYDAINLKYTATGADGVIIPQVSAAETCDDGGGWYYENTGGTSAPDKLSLCPASCETVRNDPTGRLDVVLGCQTILR